MQRREFWRDQIRVVAYVAESSRSRDRKLDRIVEARVVERSLAVHFEDGNQSVPMGD
jgi:hypothetical protein